MTQSQLADSLERSPSTITKMVQRMERSGFWSAGPTRMTNGSRAST